MKFYLNKWNMKDIVINEWCKVFCEKIVEVTALDLVFDY